jgi:hypothetical protein
LTKAPSIASGSDALASLEFVTVEPDPVGIRVALARAMLIAVGAGVVVFAGAGTALTGALRANPELLLLGQALWQRFTGG